MGGHQKTIGRKRLSRQEAQAQTRERLIEAAARLFTKHGFGGTSLRDIAEEAGYSQGAFYSNFPCKEAVLLELLKRHVLMEAEQFEAITANREQLADRIVTDLEAWFTRFEKDREWSILAIELQLHALRSRSFAKSYASLWLEHEQRVAKLLGRAFECLGKTAPAHPEQLAAGIIAITNGMVVQRSALRPTHIAPVIKVFLRAILGVDPDRQSESLP